MNYDPQQVINEVGSEPLVREDLLIEPEDRSVPRHPRRELEDLVNETTTVLSRLDDEEQAILLDGMINSLSLAPEVLVRYGRRVPIFDGDDAAELEDLVIAYDRVEGHNPEWKGEITPKMQEWLLDEERVWKIVMFYVTEKRYGSLRSQVRLLGCRIRAVYAEQEARDQTIKDMRIILSEYDRRPLEERRDLLGGIVGSFLKDDEVFTQGAPIPSHSTLDDWLSDPETWDSMRSLTGGRAAELDKEYTDVICNADEIQVSRWLAGHEAEILDVAMAQYSVFDQELKYRAARNGVSGSPLVDLLESGRWRESVERRAFEDPDVVAAEDGFFLEDSRLDVDGE